MNNWSRVEFDEFFPSEFEQILGYQTFFYILPNTVLAFLIVN